VSKDLLKDSEFSPLKTHKSCEEYHKWSIPEPKELKEENEVREGKIGFWF
jgi:hypothetical protein